MHIPLHDAINLRKVLDFLEHNDGKILFYRFETRISTFVDTVIDTLWGLFPPQELILFFDEEAIPIPSLLLDIGQQIQARAEALGIVNVARAFVITSNLFKNLEAIVAHYPERTQDDEFPKRREPPTLAALQAISREFAAPEKAALESLYRDFAATE